MGAVDAITVNRMIFTPAVDVHALEHLILDWRVFFGGPADRAVPQSTFLPVILDLSGAGAVKNGAFAAKRASFVVDQHWLHRLAVRTQAELVLALAGMNHDFSPFDDSGVSAGGYFDSIRLRIRWLVVHLWSFLFA